MNEKLTTGYGFTRRQFLDRLGAAGGSVAVYQALTAMGLLATPAFGEPMIKPVKGQGKKVAILGAGLSGLTVAYELSRAGYDCTILEASHRVGGRSFTVRGGDLIDELGNRQICQFDKDPDLYFNAGPARIPGEHQRILGYCRELGVPLEVFVNENRNAWVHDSKAFGGTRIRNREYISDARGFMSELAAKSITPSMLNKEFDDIDAERMLAFLRSYGDLDEKLLYKGTTRAGFNGEYIMTQGQMKQPLDFSQIMQSSFWQFQMHWGELESMSAPVLQMVGGNDAIIKAFQKHVGDKIQTKSQVTSIKNHERGVTLTYLRGGKPQTLEADYCLNSISGPILRGIDNNFSNEYSDSLKILKRGQLFKLAFQTKERFWEKEHIYGGISWTDQEIMQIIYPSNGFQSTKGVVIGAYLLADGPAKKFTLMSSKERLETAIQQGEKLHPGYASKIENGCSIAWYNMNHILGCGSILQQGSDATSFERIRQPEGRHILMGDQCAYHAGWQEAAIGSAHYAMGKLNELVQSDLRRA